MNNLMAIEFPEPTAVMITDPCYLGISGLYELFCSKRVKEITRGVDKTAFEHAQLDIAAKYSAKDYQSFLMAVYKLKEALNVKIERVVNWIPVRYGFTSVGLNKAMIGDTIYGDWNCTVFATSRRKGISVGDAIGGFCADGGLYIVCDAAEVAKVTGKTPVADHTTTILPGFMGTVEVVPRLVAEKDAAQFIHTSTEIRLVGTAYKGSVSPSFETRQTEA